VLPSSFPLGEVDRADILYPTRVNKTSRPRLYSLPNSTPNSVHLSKSHKSNQVLLLLWEHQRILPKVKFCLVHLFSNIPECMVKPHLTHFTTWPCGPLFRQREHVSLDGVTVPLTPCRKLTPFLRKRVYHTLSLFEVGACKGVPSRFAFSAASFAPLAPDLVVGGSGVPN
jgi:hypothetical protein